MLFGFNLFQLQTRTSPMTITNETYVERNATEQVVLNCRATLLGIHQTREPCAYFPCSSTPEHLSNNCFLHICEQSKNGKQHDHFSNCTEADVRSRIRCWESMSRYFDYNLFQPITNLERQGKQEIPKLEGLPHPPRLRSPDGISCEQGLLGL